MKKSILLVGGGSGGHIFPVIAIAEELDRRSIEYITVGARNSLEAKLYQKYCKHFVIIQSGKLRRYLTLSSLISNVLDVFKVIYGVIQSVIIIYKYGVRVVFCKGGFVALPVVIAAVICRKKIFVHESDTVMGLTNKFASRFAQKVFSAFPVKDVATKRVGIPLRSEFINSVATALPQQDSILIIPGSQGSVAINNVVHDSIKKLLDYTNIVHVTGVAQYEKFKHLEETTKTYAHTYKAVKFIDDDIVRYYKDSTLIVARSSATVLAEAAAVKRPVITVPLPGSAGDHQSLNAQALAQLDAVVAFNQSEFTAEVFVGTVIGLLSDRKKSAKLAENLNQYLGSAQATKVIVSALEDAAKE